MTLEAPLVLKDLPARRSWESWCQASCAGSFAIAVGTLTGQARGYSSGGDPLCLYHEERFCLELGHCTQKEETNILNTLPAG